MMQHEYSHNASIMHQSLAPKVESKGTKANFIRLWAEEVLTTVRPFRSRIPKGICIVAQPGNADLVSTGSASTNRLAEHELQNMGDVVRSMGYRTRAAHEGPKKRRRIPNGKCFYGDDCRCAQRTSQLHCRACNEGKGAYWHLPCFFATHRCHFGS